SVRRGGQFKLLRVHTVDGRARALMRRIGPHGSVDYLDFVPIRQANGRVVAEDISSASNGELATETVRRMQLKLAAEQQQGPPGHPQSTAKLWAPNVPKINDMLRAKRERKYAEAIQIYRSLPTEIRAEKSIYLRYLWASEAVSDTEFLVALDGFRRQFPG